MIFSNIVVIILVAVLNNQGVDAYPQGIAPISAVLDPSPVSPDTTSDPATDPILVTGAPLTTTEPNPAGTVTQSPLILTDDPVTDPSISPVYYTTAPVPIESNPVAIPIAATGPIAAPLTTAPKKDNGANDNAKSNTSVKTKKNGATITETVATSGDEDTKVESKTVTRVTKKGNVISKTTSKVLEMGSDPNSKLDDVEVKTMSKSVVKTTKTGDLVTKADSKVISKSGKKAVEKVQAVATEASTSAAGNAEAKASSTASNLTKKNGATVAKAITKTETVVKPGSSAAAKAASTSGSGGSAPSGSTATAGSNAATSGSGITSANSNSGTTKNKKGAVLSKSTSTSSSKGNGGTASSGANSGLTIVK
nr:cadhesin 6B [Limnephilus flavicornis]